MYFTLTWSPALIWSKFFTSGPATMVFDLPSGPLSVTVRFALSTASTEATIDTTLVSVRLPGVDTVVVAAPAPVGCCANAAGEAATSAATRKRVFRLVGFIAGALWSYGNGSGRHGKTGTRARLAGPASPCWTRMEKSASMWWAHQPLKGQAMKHTSSLVPLTLALGLVASPAAFAANDPWDATFTVQLGAFRADAETTVRLDGEGRNGTEVSFESNLGVQRTKTLPELQFVWRFNERHALEGSWISLNRSGSRTLSGSIDWGDVTFPVNATVDSSFDSDVLRVSYRYSPIHANGNELSLLLGLHYTRLSTSISSATGTVSDSASVDVPLPTIGVRGSARFADNWRVVGFAQAMKVKVGDYDGEMLNASVGVEWAFLPQAYAGVGYNYYHYNLTSEKGNARGRFDFDFDGPAVYAAWSFR